MPRLWFWKYLYKVSTRPKEIPRMKYSDMEKCRGKSSQSTILRAEFFASHYLMAGVWWEVSWIQLGLPPNYHRRDCIGEVLTRVV